MMFRVMGIEFRRVGIEFWRVGTAFHGGGIFNRVAEIYSCMGVRVGVRFGASSRDLNLFSLKGVPTYGKSSYTIETFSDSGG